VRSTWSGMNGRGGAGSGTRTVFGRRDRAARASRVSRVSSAASCRGEERWTVGGGRQSTAHVVDKLPLAISLQRSCASYSGARISESDNCHE